MCQFVDDKIAELRENVKGTKFCLRDVCKAAKEGVDEFEKFVRGRRGSDPRKVTKKANIGSPEPIYKRICNKNNVC